MDRSVTIHWKTGEQYFTVVLFVFQFQFQLMNFGLGTVMSDRFK